MFAVLVLFTIACTMQSFLHADKLNMQSEPKKKTEDFDYNLKRKKIQLLHIQKVSKSFSKSLMFS